MATRTGFWHDALRRAIDVIGSLLLPRGCAGCDTPDEVLCPRCRSLFAVGEETAASLIGNESAAGAVGDRRCMIERRMPSIASGSVAACASYRGAARHAILSWKDHGDAECDAAFAELLTDLAARRGLLDGAAPADRPLIVVPVPSSRSSIRKRGRWHMRDLARRMARESCLRGYDVHTRCLLTMSGVRGKSVETRSAGERAGRLDAHRSGGGGLRVHIDAVSRRLLDAGAMVVVIDDIMTTGSTMRRVVAALTDVGIAVTDALCLASVASPRRR
ncbi:ComF family protein [Bifidobacterium jacchi]|uniref:ComF family protein n=1 Tax=Bifidobacterium jacchi TaxID=2490545 RepID=A0A5N5RN10_9BIFI|nr:phosphoribosyltransferase family protein [Bifidobacterium jacchi]KAB5608339.1 ComF family protein [Bifidobacterium jacchi]